MRLRWPTRSALARPRLLVSCCSAACSPASHLKLTSPALSLTSSCRVSMALFLGLRAGQQTVNNRRVGFGGQGMTNVGIRHQPGDFRQQLQVCLGGVFRNQQNEQQIRGAAVGGIKAYRFAQANKGRARFFQVLDAAVWNGNLVSEGSRAEAFPRDQALNDCRARDAVVIFKEKTRLLECAFFARDR